VAAKISIRCGAPGEMHSWGSGQGPGMARSSVRGCPSAVKGHPKILSNRFAESIFGTHPLSGGDLCTPSGQRPRARQEPARTGRGPSPARCGSVTTGEKLDVPAASDQPVNIGKSRSLPDSPAHRLTCGLAG